MTPLLYWLWLTPALPVLILCLLALADDFAHGHKPRWGSLSWCVAAFIPVLNWLLCYWSLIEIKIQFRRA